MRRWLVAAALLGAGVEQCAALRCIGATVRPTPVPAHSSCRGQRIHHIHARRTRAVFCRLPSSKNPDALAECLSEAENALEVAECRADYPPPANLEECPSAAESTSDVEGCRVEYGEDGLAERITVQTANTSDQQEEQERLAKAAADAAAVAARAAADAAAAAAAAARAVPRTVDRRRRDSDAAGGGGVDSYGKDPRPPSERAVPVLSVVTSPSSGVGATEPSNGAGANGAEALPNGASATAPTDDAAAPLVRGLHTVKSLQKALDAAGTDRIVVIKFFAPWCSACRSVRPTDPTS